MKILKYGLIVLLVILAVLFVAPFLLKGKIVELVKKEANKQMNATLAFNEDISLSLFSSFPDLSLSIKDLSIAGKDNFEKDTLFSASETGLTLDLMSVIRGESVQIRKVLLRQPRIHAIILSDGKANWDITLPDTAPATPEDTASSAFHVKLKSLEVKDGFLVYDDREGNIYAKMEGINYNLEGDFSEVLFTLKNKLEVAALTCAMDGIPYLSSVKASGDAAIDADMNNFKFTFRENEFMLNELSLGMNGTFAMPGNDMVMDLAFEARKNEFKNFLSLIPALYANDFKSLEAKGTMALKAFVKGTFNDTQMPGFGLNLQVQNGWFKYPALPTSLENVQVNLAVENPDGVPDHTKIDLSKLHLEIAGNPFDARLLASTPISDPYVDATLKGMIDFGKLGQLVPMPDQMKLAGVVTADMSAKGKVSAAQRGDLSAFNASGTIACKEVVVSGPSVPKPVELKTAQLDFTPTKVSMPSFDAKIGSSDLKLKGAFTDFYAYYLGNGVLKGNLEMNSSLLDLNELMGESSAEAAAPADTAAMEAPVVPANMDLTFSAGIAKLKYTNLDIDQFKGTVKVKDQKLLLENIGLQTLGSEMRMDGAYINNGTGKPAFDMHFGMKNLDIQKAFATFNTVKKLAPAAEHIFGMLNAEFNLTTVLSKTMDPDFPTMFASGFLNLPNAEIKGVTLMEKLAGLLQKPEYRQAGLYNTRIAFKVEDGRVKTEPFDIKMGGQKLTLSGSSGLDQTLAYTGTMLVPRKDLGAADKAMAEALTRLNTSAGTSVKMNETLPLGLRIGGTFTNPEITTNMAELAKAEASGLADQLKAEALKKKQELEAQAKAETQKMIQQAEAQAKAAADKAKAEALKVKQETEAKAKAEADRLKKEAEAKAKAEADKLKNKAKEEAKDKLKGLFKP